MVVSPPRFRMPPEAHPSRSCSVRAHPPQSKCGASRLGRGAEAIGAVWCGESTLGRQRSLRTVCVRRLRQGGAVITTKNQQIRLGSMPRLPRASLGGQGWEDVGPWMEFHVLLWGRQALGVRARSGHSSLDRLPARQGAKPSPEVGLSGQAAGRVLFTPRLLKRRRVKTILRWWNVVKQAVGYLLEDHKSSSVSKAALAAMALTLGLATVPALCRQSK